MVIQEAENIRQGVLTFEDERIDDEPEPELPRIEEPEPQSMWDIVYGREEERRSSVVADLEYLWRLGYTAAAYKLGKLYRDGIRVVQDYEKAEQWFTQAAQAGDCGAEYVLGKLLLEQGKTEDGIRWLLSAANHGNSYAMYRIGKELLAGEHLDRDPDLAREYFVWAGQHGNAAAQYALGKLLLEGRELPKDKEEALRWLELSAAQGNAYAQFLMERADEPCGPAILLSATKLLHHMSRIFRDNSVAPAIPQGLKIDSQRRRQMQEKRLAMGHKIDDHEDYVPTQEWEQTM